MTKKTAIGGAASALLLGSSDPQAAADLDADLFAQRERWRGRVLDAAVEIAMRDEVFRKRLLSKMRDLGEQRPRRSTSAFDVLQVASAYELFALGWRDTRQAGRLMMPHLFDELAKFLSITPAQARKRYYLAKKKGLLPV